MINFIGVGTQRSATSWLYSCLYEHPEICAPEKEIHFFSRPRYTTKGISWYKEIFRNRCDSSAIKGEFSTSYLSHVDAAIRIKKHFPSAKILISLRKPTDRAYSQYLLHAKVGWLDPEQVSYKAFLDSEPSAKAQSLYYEQVKRFFDLFPREQIHIVLKEQIDEDPIAVLRGLFSFLEVDQDFTPSLINRVINSGNRPKRFWINRLMHRVSEYMYKHGFDALLFTIKKTGVPAMIRRFNSAGKSVRSDDTFAEELHRYFKDDVNKTEILTGLPLSQYWDY